MAQSHFSHIQWTIWAGAKSRQECADIMRRARFDAETRAATAKAITESRELMAKIDALMLKPMP